MGGEPGGAAVGRALQRGRDPNRGRGQPGSFRPKEGSPPPSDDDPGNPSVDFRGERRSNETHVSTTAPEARLLRKGRGKEARLAPGPCPDENRPGLLMDFTVSSATGTAERDTVPELLDGLRERSYRPRTLGADRGYDTKDCVRDIRARRVTRRGLCAPSRRSTGPAGPAKPARRGRAGGFRVPRTDYTPLPRAFGGTDGIPNLFFSSLLILQW